jgi:hypothetical protein
VSIGPLRILVRTTGSGLQRFEVVELDGYGGDAVLCDQSAAASIKARSVTGVETVMTERTSGASDGRDESEPGIGPQAHAPDDVDLRESLVDLSRLAASEGQQGLEQMLTHVAEFAVRAIPGVDGAGLTLFQDDRPDTVVASAEFVREVDAIQYGIGEGPCITAAAEGRTVRSGSLGGDRAWPRFGPRIGRLGVHSVLSLPLLSPGGVLGSMNVYAHAKGRLRRAGSGTR